MSKWIMSTTCLFCERFSAGIYKIYNSDKILCAALMKDVRPNPIDCFGPPLLNAQKNLKGLMNF